MLTRMTPQGGTEPWSMYSMPGSFPSSPEMIEMTPLERLQSGVTYQRPSRRARSYPKVDTSLKGKGVGVQKAGYNLPPVKLPGLSEKAKNRIAKQVEEMQSAASAGPQIQSPPTNRMDPRLRVAAQGIASVVGPALLEEVARVIPGRRTDASDFLRQYGQYAAMIPGLGPYAYLFTSLGGPLLDILIASAEAGARNQMVQGAMTAPVGMEEYVEFLRKHPDANMTMDEYKQYKAELAAYENEGKSCRRITKEMLGDMTLEEYAEENDIPVRSEADDRGPPQYKKFTPDEVRQPTKEELDILQGIRVM